MSLLPKGPWVRDDLKYVVGDKGLYRQIRRLGSKIHIYGHTHVNGDNTLHKTRYVQHALGHGNERWTNRYEPKFVYSAPIESN